jgi:hypothetical protein
MASSDPSNTLTKLPLFGIRPPDQVCSADSNSSQMLFKERGGNPTPVY